MNNIYNIIYSFLYKCINILNLLNKIYILFKYENILKMVKEIVFNILKMKKQII